MKFENRGVHSLEQRASIEDALSRFNARSTEALSLAENAVMQGLPQADAFVASLLEQVRQEDVRAYLRELQERLAFVWSMDGLPEIVADQALLARLYDRRGALFLPAEHKTDRLIVVFTTIYNNYQMSTALMYAMLRPLGASVLFLRDDTYCTYLKGVAGFGDSIEDVAQRIMDLAAREGLERILVTGFSSGGYPSLYAASFIPCAAYLGLSIYVDYRQGAGLPRQLRFGPVVEKHLTEIGVGPYQRDLKPLVAARPGTFPVTLYYGDQSANDRLHAMHMAGLPGVEVRSVPGAGHGLVGHLMRTGGLRTLFQEFARPPSGGGLASQQG